jgi:hypothetical protein
MSLDIAIPMRKVWLPWGARSCGYLVSHSRANAGASPIRSVYQGLFLVCFQGRIDHPPRMLGAIENQPSSLAGPKNNRPADSENLRLSRQIIWLGEKETADRQFLPTGSSSSPILAGKRQGCRASFATQWIASGGGGPTCCSSRPETASWIRRGQKF